MSMPAGTTHTKDFYGCTNYFKREERAHINQVSGETQTRVDWFFWNGSRWIDAGPGIRTTGFKQV